jgi:hypothetical protein
VCEPAFRYDYKVARQPAPGHDVAILVGDDGLH